MKNGEGTTAFRLGVAKSGPAGVGHSALEDAIGALEPHVPWRKALLERRARLYESAGSPRAPLARRELELFVKNE